MSAKIGFALIPDQETLKNIISTEDELSKKYHFTSKLGFDHNLPHVTIFQNTFDDKIPYETILNKVAVEFTRLNIGTIHFSDVIYEYGGWYFYLLQKTDKLQELHEYALYHTRDYIVDKPIYADESLPYWQQKGILDYGYRYAGEAYMPHVTLSRTAENKHNQAIIEDYKERLSAFPKEAQIQKLTAYKMGENGTHAETLGEVVLLPCRESDFVSY